MKPLYVLAAIAALLLGACSSRVDASEAIAAAEQQASRGQYSEAVDACNRIWAEGDTSAFTVDQLCRMAMIYAAAADNDIDNDTNMSAAVRCFDRAIAENADSTQMFIACLPLARQASAATAIQLLHSRDLDGSRILDPEDEEMSYVDSVAIDSIL